MPFILSVAEAIPPFVMKQELVTEFAKELFSSSFRDIDRLLSVFQNGQIQKRHFAKDLVWFKEDHSFSEKNDVYIEIATTLGVEAIEKCLGDPYFLNRGVSVEEIEAIFLISSSGIATPTIDAHIMNALPFSPSTKRIPIWGLGCAGGASGLARAYDYCIAYPKAKVLVVTIELCSLTFQKNDRSKSNLIGTSLFADGVACALVCGDEDNEQFTHSHVYYPKILATKSTLFHNTLNVMGWDLTDSGLNVIFSKDIPSIVTKWMYSNVKQFLSEWSTEITEIDRVIAHPGGKKVLEAYVQALQIDRSMVDISLQVLSEYGNMSSSTILYVLKRHMQQEINSGELGLATALGPGFSSELLLLRWEEA